MEAYWKRFAASGIGFVRKYRFDPFLRTEANIIFLQAALAFFLLAVLAIVVTELYRNASLAVSQGIVASLAPHATPQSVGSSVISQLSGMRTRTV